MQKGVLVWLKSLLQSKLSYIIMIVWVLSLDFLPSTKLHLRVNSALQVILRYYTEYFISLLVLKYNLSASSVLQLMRPFSDDRYVKSSPLSIKDQEEGARRSEFVRELLMSTFVEDELWRDSWPRIWGESLGKSVFSVCKCIHEWNNM